MTFLKSAGLQPDSTVYLMMSTRRLSTPTRETNPKRPLQHGARLKEQAGSRKVIHGRKRERAKNPTGHGTASGNKYSIVRLTSLFRAKNGTSWRF